MIGRRLHFKHFSLNWLVRNVENLTVSRDVILFSEIQKVFDTIFSDD